MGAGILAAFCLALAPVTPLRAATASNARSPLGMNLLAIRYSSEQPFIDVFKTSAVSPGRTSGWITHDTAGGAFDTGEEAYLQCDANGYPTTLSASAADPHHPQSFNSVAVLLLRAQPRADAGKGSPYPAGQYIIEYDGQGTLRVGADAALVESSPGRLVFKVAHPSPDGGIALFITSTDPKHTGNYLRNIRVVAAGQESLLRAGNVFNPTFLRLLQNFRVLRAMQWLEVNDEGGLLTDWSQRPLTTDAGWGGRRGVPLEVVLGLCNAVSADCWLNVPHMADDDYIIEMARLAHAQLGGSQRAYVEFSNEVWNSGFASSAYATARGREMWPRGGADFTVRQNWYGMRTAQTCDLWKSVWGRDAARVVCVMGAQADNPWTATQSLRCVLWRGSGNAPCAGHGIDTVAIAPYFSVPVQSSWLTAADGGLASLFAAVEADALPTSSRWEAAYHAALTPYHIALTAYESGQSFAGFPTHKDGSAMVNLFIAANRDPRMASAYTTMLNDWKSNGGQMALLFADIGGPSQYGEWGALESILDTVSPLERAPPKWRAIQNFISDNNCWWSGCAGEIE